MPMLAVAAVGLAIGLVAAPRPAPATGAGAQVTADNALVDQWVRVVDGGTRADFDAMVRPNVHFASTMGAGYTYGDADALWTVIEHARTVDKHVHARTSDVSRYGSVIVWSGSWHSTSAPTSETTFVWTVWLDKTGKFINIYETLN
jgi:hypothetical protein